METYMEKLKTKLFDLIQEMSPYHWLYVSDPKRNFGRARTLLFEKVLATKSASCKECTRSLFGSHSCQSLYFNDIGLGLSFCFAFWVQ